MIRQKIAALSLISALLLPSVMFAQAPAAAPQTPLMKDDSTDKIKDEGMNRSQVMPTLRYLTDVIGARLTNSPAQKRANNWTRDQFTKWGLQNAKLDSWGNFGRGWELKKFSATVVEPQVMPLQSYPKAWSPATNGEITGEVVFVDATDEAGLEKYKGKLKGAIVLTAPERNVPVGFEAVASRRDEKDLLALANATGAPQTGGRGGQMTPAQAQLMMAQFQFQARKMQFYMEEGVAVLVEPSQLDAGTLRVMGASVPQPPPVAGQPAGNPFAGGGRRAWDKDAKTIPQVVAAVEQYNRLMRLVKQGVSVKMTVDVGVQFYEEDLNGYNTIAEIPGTDLKDEVVIIGAHMDSWHSGTGATDNGAGTAVVMEAMRILQASGMKPRRTIRVALWTGEEQGLYGSRGYVAKNYAESTGGGQGVAPQLTKKPDYEKISAYYNLDNGTGKIRGIYMQGNEDLRPIFRNWFTPFADMGASTLTIQGTGGTDHVAFDSVGIPGFQFIQDPIEYFGRTWHTTQDVSDRAIEDDLKQSAVIMATFAYNTAMMNDKLPRKKAAMPLGGGVRAMLMPKDLNAENDELLFNQSNLGYSICGHTLPANEVPLYFPTILAVGDKYAGLGE